MNMNKASSKGSDSKARDTNHIKILHQDQHATSHQRSLSADFCSHSSASVITVRKAIKEPQPPPRRASLIDNQLTSNPTSKRYSCPPMGICQLLSSSSSSSSCSSPPPIQTSTITGRDPLGWKLQPKTRILRSKRLSLQTPLVVPEQLSTAATTPSQEFTKPKPPRRHNSDSSALLKRMATPLPVKTVEELQQVCLRPVAHNNDYDDVFSDQMEDKNTVTMAKAKDAKVPPQVPYKSPMARQLFIKLKQQRTGEKDIYSCVTKKKTQTDHSKG